MRKVPRGQSTPIGCRPTLASGGRSTGRARWAGLSRPLWELVSEGVQDAGPDTGQANSAKRVTSDRTEGGPGLSFGSLQGRAVEEMRETSQGPREEANADLGDGTGKHGVWELVRRLRWEPSVVGCVVVL